MSKRAGTALPAGIETARAQLEAWRTRRRRGERIPESVWHAAALAARGHSVYRVSRALGLDYATLKRRAAGLDAGQSCVGGDEGLFVELRPSPLTCGHGCLVELEKGNGARLRIQVREGSALDWGVLKDAFLGA